MPSGPWWQTTSTARPPNGNAARQQASTDRATSSRRASTARPNSESGPSSTTRADRPAGSPGSPDGSSVPARTASRCGTVAWAAIRSRVATGVPRSPDRWVAETSRQSCPQPTPAARSSTSSCPRASTVTRGWRGSTLAPPRTGVRRGRPGAGIRTNGSTARSAPSSGAIPAVLQAEANFTAPYRPSRSVRARAVIPWSRATSTSAAGVDAPYRREYPEATWRWVNGGLTRRAGTHRAAPAGTAGRGRSR